MRYKKIVKQKQISEYIKLQANDNKICYNCYNKNRKREDSKIQKMMDKLNRQFEILQAQKKRMIKMSQSFVIGSPLFQSYIKSVNSVVLIGNNISSSFTQILIPNQISMLMKANTDIITELINKIRMLHNQNGRIKKQAQNTLTKTKTQNCSVCGQNIHQSNIRQTLITLEQNTRQQFHMAMQQFIKISEQPLFSKQQNNQFQQQLHFQLSQRQKILNTNCNRIQEFVQIMETTMADLMKLKNVQFGPNHSQNSPEFANANKISQDVSNFLQASFSKKLPPWIHKMFLRMVTSYLQQCNQKKLQTGTQTGVIVVEQNQMKQLIKEKKTLQKQNKQISDQLKQLKVCYKRLEELNNQYAVTIANMPRAIKIKVPTTRQIRQKSRKNSARIDKADSLVSSQHSPRQQEDDDPINYSILDNDINDTIIIPKRKRNNNLGNLFPQIRKNKYDNSINKNDKSNKASSKQIPVPKENDTKRGGHLSVPIPSQQANKQNVGSKQLIQKQLIQEGQSKKKSNKKLNQNIKIKKGQKSNIPDQIKQERDQQRKQISDKKRKQTQRSTNVKKTTKLIQTNEDKQNEMEYVTSHKPTKLKKVNRVKLDNVSKKKLMNDKKQETNDQVQVQEEERSSIYELKDISDSINRLKTINQKQVNDKRQYNGQNGDSFLENSKKMPLEQYNLRHNSQQIVLARKVSQDLTNKILHKRSSMHNSQNKPLNDKINIQRNSLNMYSKKLEQTLSPNPSGNKKIMKKQSVQVRQNSQSREQEEEYLGSEIKINEDHQNYGSFINNMSNTMQSQFHAYVSQQRLRHTQNIELRPSLDCLENAQSLPQTMRTPAAKEPASSSKATYKHKSAKGQKTKRIISSDDAQAKIFEVLKSHHIIPKSIDYNLFSSVISKVEQQINNDEQQLNAQQQKNYHSQSPTRVNTHRKGLSDVKSSCGEESPRDSMEQAHNSVYGRLFLNKAVAYKYQQSMTKSYHKKILKQLTQNQRDFCYELYNSLCQTKKVGQKAYNQFCSILRYPYQTLYNNFEVVNFVSEMSFDTFEYFFRKIVWFHRKCSKDSKTGICDHIQEVSLQLKQLLGNA